MRIAVESASDFILGNNHCMYTSLEFYHFKTINFMLYYHLATSISLAINTFLYYQVVNLCTVSDYRYQSALPVWLRECMENVTPSCRLYDIC